jgi:L-lactate utilization protein LutB
MSDESVKARYEAMAPVLLKKLEARRFEAYYVKDREEAKNKALSLMKEGSSVSWGGSLTMKEIGLDQAVRNGKFRLIDRDSGKTSEERRKISREGLTADIFIASANAVSMEGDIVEIDGAANRVASIIFGAGEVILIVGMNKVCKTLQEAEERAQDVAAPLNAIRLKKNTPCALNGSCVSCLAPDCICAVKATIRISMVPHRIKVILVGEDLGL